MATAGVIAEFLASVGFKADEKSLKSSLAKVAAFGVAVQTVALGIFAGITKVASEEAELSRQAEKLGTTTDKLREIGYVAEQNGASLDAVTRSMEGLVSKNPRIRDAGKALEVAGERMKGMNDQARKLYATRMGIDPSLIPALTGDVAGLKNEFRAMYDVAGMDAKEAGKSARAFMAELGKLKTMAELLVKSVSLAFMGRLRGDIENVRRVVTENFDKIRRVFEIVISVVLRVAAAISAFVYRAVKSVSGLVRWFDNLSDGQKKMVVGIGLLLAAWKLLNAGFLATPVGMLVAGLAAIVALVDDYLTYMEGGKSFLDWGPWAETIEKVVAVLKDVWNAVYAVGSAVAAGALPMLKMLNEMCRWIFNTVAGGAKILWKVFSGDFAGALEAARALMASWAASGRAIVSAFAEMVGGYFGTLWAEISDGFPNFAAWAEGAAAAIRNFLAPAIDWIREKLKGLLPDFMQKMLGISANAPAKAAAMDAPALTPGAAQAASLDNSNMKNVELNAKTDINVYTADPVAAGNQVAGRQSQVNADLVRNAKGAAR